MDVFSPGLRDWIRGVTLTSGRATKTNNDKRDYGPNNRTAGVESSRTVYGQHVRLRYFRVPQGPARVVARVDQLYFRQIQRPVAEHPHVLVAQRRQVGRVPFPNDRRRRITAHVAPDLHVVAHLGGYPVRFQRFLQRHHRQTYRRTYGNWTIGARYQTASPANAIIEPIYYTAVGNIKVPRATGFARKYPSPPWCPFARVPLASDRFRTLTVQFTERRVELVQAQTAVFVHVLEANHVRHDANGGYVA